MSASLTVSDADPANTSRDPVPPARKLPPPPPKKGPRKPAKKHKHQVIKKGGVRHEFSAGFLLYRDAPEGRRWLVLDYGKHWDYPKGHLEEGESAWRAAVRELREETGIRRVDRVGRFEKKMEYWFFSPKKGRIHKTVTYYVGRTTGEEVVLSDEHTGYAWLPFEEAVERLTFKNAKDMLTAAEESVRAGQRAMP